MSISGLGPHYARIIPVSPGCGTGRAGVEIGNSNHYNGHPAGKAVPYSRRRQCISWSTQ